MTKAPSPSALATLSAAAKRDDHLALPPEHLAAAAQRAVVQSLLKGGLLEEHAADNDQPAWRTTEERLRFALRITEAGLSAVEPSELQVAEAEMGAVTPEDALSTGQHTQGTSERGRGGRGGLGPRTSATALDFGYSPPAPHRHQAGSRAPGDAGCGVCAGV